MNSQYSQKNQEKERREEKKLLTNFSREIARC